MNTSKQSKSTETWQVGDRIEGPEVEDRGVILAIDGYQLMIQCDDGTTIYGRQKTMERMEWKFVHSYS